MSNQQGYSPSLPLNENFTLNQTAVSSIKQDLKNLVLTYEGERMMNPVFGASLYKILFEQDQETAINAARGRIYEQVRQWMPFIQIINIDIENNVDINQSIYCKISYRVPSITNEEQTLSLLLKNALDVQAAAYKQQR